jgi:hypothetical protein
MGYHAQAKSAEDLILKFYICNLKYIALLERSFNEVPIFNWKKFYSAWNEYTLKGLGFQST